MISENDKDYDMLSAAPLQEPQRQYYYMDKARRYVAEHAKKLGHPPTFCVQTFGCQMNARDSEKLSGILGSIGYVPSDCEEADFVIYNTCTVREHANLRVYGRLGALRAIKKKNPDMLLAMCGCMMQEPHVVEKIQKSFPFVDIIFGTHNLYKFAEILVSRLESGRMIIDIWQEAKDIVEDLPKQRKYPFKSGVNIMFGCDNFCSYCIVPYVRGRERSRTPYSVIEEVRRLADDGVSEVMLLGQNVNSYGKGLDENITFAGLLREIEKVDGIRRIRFMTSHPKDLSEELIDTMAESSKICRHLHLPVQSGSSRILKLMNRHYDRDDYLSLVERLRRAMPELSLTTDIIVGFPTESDSDFEDTLSLVERCGYDSAFTFIYSKRSGTRAAVMDGQVSREVTKERFDRLLCLLKSTCDRACRRFEGQVHEVLVEDIAKSDNASYVSGRLGSNLLVHFEGQTGDIGTYKKVYLETCKGFYYMGRLV